MSSEVTVGYLPVGHDPSIAIVDDTGVLAVAEEERYSRVKRGRFITDPLWLFDVLSEFGVEPDDVTCLAIPNIAALQERRTTPSLVALPLFGQARTVSSIVNRVVARMSHLESVEHHRHHVCHAASTYLVSPFDSAAVVTIDGMGETETASISLGIDGRLERIESTELPNSLGYLYQALAWWSGLTGSEREGKFMGLASWAKPTQVDMLRERFMCTSDDGVLRVCDALARLPVTVAAWNEYVTQHLGPRRGGDPDMPDLLAADIAASVQVIVEEALFRYCERAGALTGAANLCLAGGVFMNTVANGALQRSGLFEDVFVQPLASDNGLALGAALLSHRRRSPKLVRWVMTTAALGTPVAPYAVPASAADLVANIATRILSGQVIGWVRGRAEVGARALGQRSVLADARDPETPDRINHKLKRREKWRPFAPIILEEDAVAWGLRPSPFMTFVHPVPEYIRKQFPAVFHIDGSARLQTVGQEGDPLLRALLLHVREQIGTGILLNTSLNGPGMPIVRTTGQALDLLHTSGLDCLVVGDTIVERRDVESRAALCTCGGLDIATLVELAPPEPGSCLEQHATTVHLVRLSMADDGSLNAELPRFGSEESVTVLVPTWIDLLTECTPKLVEWLQRLQTLVPTPLVLVDANYRTATLADLVSSPRPGLGGLASEIESFWLDRVSQWQL